MSTRPMMVSRRPPERSASRPKKGWRTAETTALVPKTKPIRAGPRPSRVDRKSGSTGSSMQIVAETATTAAKHEATAGIRITAAIGTRLSTACPFGTSIQVNAAAVRRPSRRPSRTAAGCRRPHTPSAERGPSMNPTPVPDMTNPMTRPRSAGPHIRNQREADNPRDASAAPGPAAPQEPGQTLRERERRGRRRQRDEPADERPFLPMRSDTAPIGIDTPSSVTPNDPKSSPIIVGDAPRRRLRSGSTGTATE